MSGFVGKTLRLVRELDSRLLKRTTKLPSAAVAGSGFCGAVTDTEKIHLQLLLDVNALISELYSLYSRLVESKEPCVSPNIELVVNELAVHIPAIKLLYTEVRGASKYLPTTGI